MRGVMGIDDIPWEGRVRFLGDDLRDEAWDWLLLKALLYRLDAQDRLQTERAEILTAFLERFRESDIEGMRAAVADLEGTL